LWNKPFVKRIKYSLGIGVMLVLLAGCHRHGSESGAIVYTPNQFAAPEATEPPIRIAVTAAFISEAGVGVYDKLARYLEVRTGYPCKLVSGFSYRTVDKMLAAGAIEVACVCGLPYVLSQELPNPPTRLMAVPIPADPRYRGRPVYYSDIIVRLVELMGGQIGVYSQPGQGSCFWFEVPLPVIQENAPEETTAQPSGSALNSHELDGVRVLLVEDNPVNQKVAIRMLQKLGCVVELAENGQQALEKLERASYDIVLMDMQMPVMDGLTATRLLRQREQQTGHHQVVIALTANAMQTDRELCLEAGMDDYLSKPLTLDALQVMLLRWVAQHKQRAA
jgi:CheY-like chemotaxis protein